MSAKLCSQQELCRHYTDSSKRKVHHIRITNPCKHWLALGGRKWLHKVLGGSCPRCSSVGTYKQRNDTGLLLFCRKEWMECSKCGYVKYGDNQTDGR